MSSFETIYRYDANGNLVLDPAGNAVIERTAEERAETSMTLFFNNLMDDYNAGQRFRLAKSVASHTENKEFTFETENYDAHVRLFVRPERSDNRGLSGRKVQHEGYCALGIFATLNLGTGETARLAGYLQNGFSRKTTMEGVRFLGVEKERLGVNQGLFVQMINVYYTWFENKN